MAAQFCGLQSCGCSKVARSGGALPSGLLACLVCCCLASRGSLVALR
ncbi:hypothetical protein COLO4_07237 [Corchorus olitorius]|uniref:Uncharacterized protein n=1 Tax=Corchorus olitorius TaxID=93759 RepID=A0A1R3KKD4_9ROSI|nr:hypothetical protein COLO4_07237 [Corchorus olitorius]